MKLLKTLPVFALLAIPSLDGKEFDLNKPARAVYTAAGQSVSQETLKGVPVLRFSLDPAKKKWGEFYWQNPGMLPKFRTLKVSVRLRKGEGEAPRVVRLRIADRSSEVFEYSPKEPLNFDAEGKCTAVYEINAEGKQKKFWGGNRDGILDLPCCLQGMAAVFPGEEEKCDVLITGISWKIKGGTRK